MSNNRVSLRQRLSVRVTLAGILVLAPSASALIFISSGDPSFNATAPGGALADSGWQFQGTWGGLLGTPVAPGYFLTAKHGGGGVGGTFGFQGLNYVTTAKFDHPTADLTLWQVSGTFSTYAPLYTGTDELGKGLTVFGRSATRGDEVTVPGASVADLRGWKWNGTGGSAMRWGENTVNTTVTLSGADYLTAGFSRTGGPNEATLAIGDSGGGVFIQEGGTWKLAGINYAVESEFRTSADGTTFQAAIFDAGGLFVDPDGGGPLGYTEIQDLPQDLVASFYATRVSSYVGWIEGITAVPEPRSTVFAIGLGLAVVAGVRRLGRR